jgi:hypothetical protein
MIPTGILCHHALKALDVMNSIFQVIISLCFRFHDRYLRSWDSHCKYDYIIIMVLKLITLLYNVHMHARYTSSVRIGLSLTYQTAKVVLNQTVQTLAILDALMSNNFTYWLIAFSMSSQISNIHCSNITSFWHGSNITYFTINCGKIATEIEKVG